MNAATTGSADRVAGVPAIRDRGKVGPPRPARALIFAGISGAIVGAATIAFIYQLVFVYFLLSPEGLESRQAAEDLGGGVLPQIFLAFGVLGAAFSAGYFGRWRPVVLGLVCGAAAATTEQTIVLLGYPPVLLAELTGFAVVGLTVGSLGGWLGGRAAEQAVAGEKASYRAMREMPRAEDADAVAAAIAGVLSGEDLVGIGVWRRAPNFDGSGRLAGADGTWRSDRRRPFAPERLLRDAEGDVASILTYGRFPRGRGLAGSAREEWRAQGVKSAFVAPLLSSGGESSGVLLVAFGNGGRAARLRAALRARRRLLSTAAAASMALENQELARKKEQSDRRAGMLQERERVSREIHDSLIQCLAGATAELGVAEKAERMGIGDAAILARGRAREATNQAISEARRLIDATRPGELDGVTLPEALFDTARRVMAGSGIGTECGIEGDVRPLAPETDHALLRISQEALQNVRKHSGASCATIKLNYRPEDRVVLEVTDDGVGLGGGTRRKGLPGPPEGRDGGFGIRSMTSRAEQLGGSLRAVSPGEGGTRIVVEVLYPSREEEIGR